MHTALPLLLGAFIGWLWGVYLFVGEWIDLLLYIAIGTAGASIGTWFVDASHVAFNRPRTIGLADRMLASVAGTLLFFGFRTMW